MLSFKFMCFFHVKYVLFLYLVYRSSPLLPGASRHRKVVLSRVTELCGHAFVEHVYVSAIMLTLMHLGSILARSVMNGSNCIFFI